MDKIERYREYIQQVLTEYKNLHRPQNYLDTELICDTVRDHYQIVHVGWENQTRIYGCVLHLDIKKEKIWIQYNGTELDIAEQLVDLGVPKKESANCVCFSDQAIGFISANKTTILLFCCVVVTKAAKKKILNKQKPIGRSI